MHFDTTNRVARSLRSLNTGGRGGTGSTRALIGVPGAWLNCPD